MSKRLLENPNQQVFDQKSVIDRVAELDITRKQQRRQLNQTEKEFDQLKALLPDIASLTGHHFSLHSTNAKMLRLLPVEELRTRYGESWYLLNSRTITFKKWKSVRIE